MRITWARREGICPARSTSTIPRRLQGPFKPGVHIPTSERLTTTPRTDPPSTTPSKPQSTSGRLPDSGTRCRTHSQRTSTRASKSQWVETASWRNMLDGANIPQILTVALGYRLPFGHGRHFMNKANPFMDAVLGGWQFQTIDNFRSGVPWTPTISTDVANIGVTPQHPNIVAADACAGTGSLTHAFNRSDFAVPAAYTYGNGGLEHLQHR